MPSIPDAVAGAASAALAVPAAALDVLGKAAAAAHAPLSAFAGGLEAVGQVGRAVLGTVSALTGALQANVAAYTALYNPAATKLFELAVRDLNASIGQALMPVLKLGTAAVRSLADGFAGMGPQAKQLLAALVAAGVGAAVTAALVTGLSVAFATATGGISVAVGTLVAGAAAFAAVAAPIDQAQGAFRGFANKVVAVVDVVGAGAARVAKLFDPLLKVILDLADSALGEAGALLDPVVKGLEMMVKSLVPILTDVVPALLAFAGAMNYFNVTVFRVLAAIGSAVLDALAPVVAIVAFGFQRIAVGVAVLSYVVNAVMDVFHGIREAVMAPIRGVKAAVMGVLQPAFDELSAAFAAARELFGDFAATVREVFAEVAAVVAEFVRPVVDFVRGVLVAAFTVVADAVRAVAKAVRGFADDVRAFLGIERQKPEKDVTGKGTGMAVSNVQQGSVSSFIDRARSNAFGAGRGESDAQKTATNTGQATEHLKDLRAYFLEGKFIADLAEATKNKVGEVARDNGPSKGAAATAAAGLAIGGPGGAIAATAIRQGLRQLE